MVLFGTLELVMTFGLISFGFCRIGY